VIAPIPCSYFGILKSVSGSAMLRCSDQNDPTTSYQTEGYALIAPRHGPCRFKTGDTVGFLMATVASDTAIVEFVL